jgi:hypothetical protein
MIDWESLNLPDFEDPAATKVRLDEIHRQVLKDKGLSIVPGKNSPGFAPTEYQSRQVSVMAALGLDAKDIALVLDVEEAMVKLYYRKELRVSHNIANAMVARQALQMAMSGRFPDMTKFWLTHQAKWRPASDKDYTNDKKVAELDSAKDRLRQMVSAQHPTTKAKDPVSPAPDKQKMPLNS